MSNQRLMLALGLLSVFSYSEVSMAKPISIDCVLQGTCINGNNVMEHLKSFQGIADANKGNRAAGTTGHELSGNYIAQKL